MTLLEVMLALALTAVVLAAISMAIDLHLRMLDSRRGTVERIQLARAVLQIIANDLRATVQQNSTDFSAVAAMAEGALAGGADLGALEDLAGGDGAGGDGREVWADRLTTWADRPAVARAIPWVDPPAACPVMPAGWVRMLPPPVRTSPRRNLCRRCPVCMGINMSCRST